MRRRAARAIPGLVGAGLEETAGYARGPSAAEPVSDAFIARECPLLMQSAPFLQSAPFFQEPHWDATFDLGVAFLTEGARRDFARRQADEPVGRTDAPPLVR